jgi:hypothetical protein
MANRDTEKMAKINPEFAEVRLRFIFGSYR